MKLSITLVWRIKTSSLLFSNVFLTPWNNIFWLWHLELFTRMVLAITCNAETSPSIFERFSAICYVVLIKIQFVQMALQLLSNCTNKNVPRNFAVQVLIWSICSVYSWCVHRDLRQCHNKTRCVHTAATCRYQYASCSVAEK